MIAALVSIPAGAAGLSPGVNLFFIKRSLNDNEFHYDAVVDTERCVWQEPYVDYYWRDLAEFDNGKPEYSEIKWWEHDAYGSYVDLVSETEIHIKLRPFYANGIYRPVIARLTDGPAGCSVSITIKICAAEAADFQAAFIQVTDSWWPDYVYFELLGYQPGTRGSASETDLLAERFDKSRMERLLEPKDRSGVDDDYRPYCSQRVKSRWISGVTERGRRMGRPE